MHEDESRRRRRQNCGVIFLQNCEKFFKVTNGVNIVCYNKNGDNEKEARRRKRKRRRPQTAGTKQKKAGQKRKEKRGSFSRKKKENAGPRQTATRERMREKRDAKMRPSLYSNDTDSMLIKTRSLCLFIKIKQRWIIVNKVDKQNQEKIWLRPDWEKGHCYGNEV